jgi:hypothetical protein
MSLSSIWAEIEHILGIVTAAAPIIALVDPAAASGIGSAEATLALVTPAVNAIVANADSATTPDQLQAHIGTLVNFGLNTAIASGRIAPEKVVAVQAAIPALIATAVSISAAANKPLTPAV